MDTLGTIFIVEDDRKIRDLVSAFLKYQGYGIVHATQTHNIFDTIHEKHIGIVVANLKFLADIAPGFIEQAKKTDPLLVLIGYGSNAHITSSNEHNVFLMSKPLNLDELESLVTRARELQTMKLPDSSAASYQPHKLCSSIIGKSSKMIALFELIEKVAESSATVLIQGESGTGKELAARAIHLLSSRSDKNFVPINCAAIPDDLIESELFGHVKGSFTGAYANRMGRFEMADKGTLFLDEIGDMKANLQVKLLRVLQSKEFEPVGATKSQKVDVRIIAASNKKLEALVESQDFREDLFYRLSVIPITIPPLRERRDDIPLLIETFLSRFNSEKRHAVTGFSKETLDILCAYDWPGNVRELENLVERLVILKDNGLVAPEDLPEKYLSRKPPIQAPAVPVGNEFPAAGICLNSALEEFENRLILQALERTGGNKKEAAILLNLKRTTLIEKLKKKNLSYGREQEAP